MPDREKNDNKLPTWDEVKTVIKSRDKKKIQELGKKFNRPRIVQATVTVDEIEEQLMIMGPHNHVLVGPLLLDMAAKL